MRDLLLLNKNTYLQPYGSQLSTPPPKMACRFQYSYTTIILTTLLGGGLGYGLKRLAPKTDFTFNLYNKLPMPLQYGLPFISAGLFAFPLVVLRAATSKQCSQSQKEHVSTYISLE